MHPLYKVPGIPIPYGKKFSRHEKSCENLVTRQISRKKLCDLEKFSKIAKIKRREMSPSKNSEISSRENFLQYLIRYRVHVDLSHLQEWKPQLESAH